MTKGTKVFRIIISILLALTILWGAFCTLVFVLFIDRYALKEKYGFSVAGVDVTFSTADDVLGDGTVTYDAYNNVLTLENAVIECEGTAIYSRIDLMIRLVGENKIAVSGESITGIYASNYQLSKDLTFFGDGSLTIDYVGTCTDAMGIHGKNIRTESDITINMPNCTNIVNGLYCESTLAVSKGATVTVNNGAGKYSTAVKARDNLHVENGSSLIVNAAAGTTDVCKGLSVGGVLMIWDDSTVKVTVDDSTAKAGECINAAGLVSLGKGASLTASSKSAYAIECSGAMELNPGSTVTASTEGEGTDLFCYGAIVDYGGTINGEAEVLGDIHRK